MLAASEAELQRLKRDDPELVSEYQSTKGFTANYESFDDRTYLRFIAYQRHRVRIPMSAG